MSDLQARKRKDKRRKKGPFKEDSVAGEDVQTGTTNSNPNSNAKTDDYNIHVYHDAHTGGGWCAKIIFFVLLSILGLLIGVIIFEYRGSTDLDAPLQDSKYAEIFHGWVDDTPQLHDDENDHAIDDDHDAENSEEDDHSHQEDDDHDESAEEELDLEEEQQDDSEDEKNESDEGNALSNEDEGSEQDDDDDIDNETEDNPDDASEENEISTEDNENLSTEDILNSLDNLEQDEPLEEVTDSNENSDETEDVIDNNPAETEMLKQVEENATEAEEESSGGVKPIKPAEKSKSDESDSQKGDTGGSSKTSGAKVHQEDDLMDDDEYFREHASYNNVPRY